MFNVLILVCPALLLPQQCQVANAIDVLEGPPASNEIACGVSAQEYIAQTSLAPDQGDYLKIQCSRARALHDTLPESASVEP